jgi:hypothetical protein
LSIKINIELIPCLSKMEFQMVSTSSCSSRVTSSFVTRSRAKKDWGAHFFSYGRAGQHAWLFLVLCIEQGIPIHVLLGSRVSTPLFSTRSSSTDSSDATASTALRGRSKILSGFWMRHTRRLLGGTRLLGRRPRRRLLLCRKVTGVGRTHDCLYDSSIKRKS